MAATSTGQQRGQQQRSVVPWTAEAAAEIAGDLTDINDTSYDSAAEEDADDGDVLDLHDPPHDKDSDGSACDTYTGAHGGRCDRRAAARTRQTVATQLRSCLNQRL